MQTQASTDSSNRARTEKERQGTSILSGLTQAIK
jgi:hypothetical protein